MYDLRTEPWIPWRTCAGLRWGRISDLTADLGDVNAVIDIAASRPDWNGAVKEFLIGMLTVALNVKNEEEWEQYWDKPPTPDQLQNALDELPAAFDLDSEDGPRFLQDFAPGDLSDQELLTIDRLLIETPGQQGVIQNKTLFVKPERFLTLGRPAAAMALITMQTYAPAGGQGNRTSMRGGGPLSTLADPRDVKGAGSAELGSLWYMLWMNVETREQRRNRARSFSANGGPELSFPWLAATRVSSKGNPAVTPVEANPAQAYFGMPRRIQLEFDGPGTCQISGREDTRTVVGFRMRNYGVEYSNWLHPLSPYYEKAGERLPVHAQPGGISWREWPDITLTRPSATTNPAACIASAGQRASLLGLKPIKVQAFGFDMDNMKARSWVSAVQPLFSFANDAEGRRRQAELTRITMGLVEGTSLAAYALRASIKRSWFQREEDASGDFSRFQLELWTDTESPFFATLDQAIGEGLETEAGSDAMRKFQRPLELAALAIFDRACPLDVSNVMTVRRTVSARFSLSMTLRGKGKFGEKLFEQLTIPVSKTSPAKKARKTKEKTK